MTTPDLGDLGEAVAYLLEQKLSQPAELHRRVTLLEEHMATTNEQIAAVTANLQNIQGDVQRLNDLATQLQTEIEQQDPALAARLQPLVDLSGQIAAATPDPEVPSDEPTP